MDKVFEKDAERFDKEVKEQEKYYKDNGRCPSCGQYVGDAECESCVDYGY